MKKFLGWRYRKNDVKRSDYWCDVLAFISIHEPIKKNSMLVKNLEDLRLLFSFNKLILENVSGRLF